ncbi:hypothetical protein DFJ74DRAFT_676392 [Hyaloraphidium curvatum]|nr:hypothetical protein DFJ74DRAFT_676392 [Hyaloraphidium curvatum]
MAATVLARQGRSFHSPLAVAFDVDPPPDEDSLPRPVSAASERSDDHAALLPGLPPRSPQPAESEPAVRIGHPDELIELLKARSGCLIVGAGVSVALAAGPEHKRLVTWRGFLDKLAETVAHLLSLPQSWLDQIREHLSRASTGPSPAPDLQVAAELIAEKCAAKDPFMRYNHLVFKILHGLSGYWSPAPGHIRVWRDTWSRAGAEENSILAKSLDMLGKLGDSPIMTTNYDVLLEDSTGRFTLSIDDLLKAQRWHRVDPAAHPNPLDHHHQYCFHLHGLYYDDPDRKFVLTSREYAVTIDDFTIALKPVLIDAESGGIPGAIVRSSINIPSVSSPSTNPSSVHQGSPPEPNGMPTSASWSGSLNTAGRPRSRLSVYSTTENGVVEEVSPLSQNGASGTLGSPRFRPAVAHNPHQHDHPRTKKERRSSARSSSLGPGPGSPAMRGNGLELDVFQFASTLPRRPNSPSVARTAGSSTVRPSELLFPEMQAAAFSTLPVPAPGPPTPSPVTPPQPGGPGVGTGPSIAFHRSMIFIGVGGTLQDVHFTSLFAALQEHNIFLHHNGLSRIKHYVLVMESEVDSIMNFVFLDSLGREVPARELLVAIVYGRDYSDLPFFLAGLAQRLAEEVMALAEEEEATLPGALEELGLAHTRHKATAVDAANSTDD